MKRTEVLGWLRRMAGQPFDFVDLLYEVDKVFKIRYPSIRVPKFLTKNWAEHELLRFLIETGTKTRLVKILGAPVRAQTEKIKRIDLTGLPTAAPVIAALNVISSGQLQPEEIKIDSTWKSQVELVIPDGVKLILNPVGG